jgi:hypothetical protein
VFAALVLKMEGDTLGVWATLPVMVFLLGLDAAWWWALFGGKREGPVDRKLLEFKFWQSLMLVGVVAGFWLFGPMTDDYPDHMRIWIAMVLGPCVILIARMLWWSVRLG